VINDIPITQVNIDKGGQEHVGRKENYPFSELIHIARRIDWRFLLPNPALGKVACLGVKDRSHLEALQLFSQSLSILSEVDLDRGDEFGYDIVVISGSDIKGIQKATDMVKPGGCLYMESFGYFNQLLRNLKNDGGRINGLHLYGLRDYSRLLGEQGFTDIQFHWHWPNFRECTKIIPLEDKTVQYAFLYARRSIKARLRSLIGRLLLRLGLLESLVPHFSMIAKREGE
jgi:hypothetical protein